MAYNLGTAYIRIAPSLQGVQKKVTDELNQAAKKSSDSFSAKFNAGTVAVGTFMGNMLTKVVSGIGNSISSHLNAAISRSDELTYRFAASMSNVGISAEEAGKEINRVSESLIGLPTTTDDAAKSIKKFASANGEISKSADYFLAINDALVAGAAPTERQAEAIQQISEAYSRGKPDMKEWRILMETMPGQMRQVSEAMGYGADKVADLGEDLRKGEVSMDEFLNTFVELDTKASGDGFINFADQAKNAVGGLEVSMTRMNTAVTRGMASLIDNLQGDTNDLGNVFSSIGSIAEGLLKGDADKIQSGTEGLIQGMQTLTPKITTMISGMVQTLAQFIRTNLPDILRTGLNALVDIIKAIALELPTIVSVLAEALPGIITMLVETLFSPDTLNLLIQAAIDTVMALVDALPDIIVALVDAIPTIIMSIIDVLTNPENAARIVLAGGQIIIALVKGIIGAVGRVIVGCVEIMDKIKNKFGELPETLVKYGKNIVEGLVKGITDAASWVRTKIQDFCNNAAQAIKDFFGIHSPSKLMAQYGKYIDQGLGNGITDNAKYATNAMDDMAEDVLGSAENMQMRLNSALGTKFGATVGTESNAISRNINQYNTFNQVANDIDIKEMSRSLGFAVETAI